MILRAHSLLLGVLAWGACAPLSRAAEPAVESVSFSRDILPLLSDKCLACHGPDAAQAKGGLRLDLRDAATRPARSGAVAIVPGKPAESELLRRVQSRDKDDLMPPPASHKERLTPDQVRLLERWIAGGAPWGRHWAFEVPQRPTPPRAVPGWTATNPIDRFVQARLAAGEMSPAPAANRVTWLRRVSFDLTGLPPTLEEVAAFEADAAPDAARRVVERLLASPHFGERMAQWWLDVARYADTDGFQADETRTNWPWRDWVIDAFNGNMPFDQFTLEQFAGDLLPEATAAQKLATCFHRNHMANGEGGRDPEESRVDYVIDRINTVGTTWLGLTLGCSQCHSHKFDPISQADYYSLSAFFNSIDEDGRAGGGAKPVVPQVSPAGRAAAAEARRLVELRKPAESAARRDAEPAFARWLETQVAATRGGFTAWHPLPIVGLESAEGTLLTRESGDVVRAGGPHPRQDDYRVIARPRLSRVTGLRLEVLPHPDHTQGRFTRGRSGEFILTDVKVQVRRPGSSQIRDLAVRSAVADFSGQQKGDRNYGDIKGVLDDDPRNGWTTQGATNVVPHTAVLALAEPLILEPDEELVVELRHRSTLGDANLGRFRLSATDQPGETVRRVGTGPLEELASRKVADARAIPAPLRERLFEQFLEDHPPYRVARAALDRANRQLAEVTRAEGRVNVMVLADRAKPRDTFVLVRGVWDKHGDRVEPGVPASVAPWPAGQPRNRLGLARWVVSRDNPLTARVIVNQLWQLMWGEGLVRTPEDFGLQGERPTHPELLDWLAVEFMDSGWDVRHVLTLIATSATYGQDSAVDAASLARDPANRLLARGARFRLPSWMLRDAALHAAGLLNPAVGGPPVRPYQPPGVWEELFMGRFTYEPSEGAAQYRRTIYAFWRRVIAPTFLFDAPQRRVCEVRTPRTNTPLQALALLNDESQREAARELAAIALRQPGGTRSRLQSISRRVLSREATDRELAVLERELGRALAHYQASPADAAAWLQVGQGAPDPRLNPAELAAHAMIASLMLNLDEAITHE